MQTLLHTYVPVKDLCLLIDAYAQVNVPMAVQYIKERWIRWWHSINKKELNVIAVYTTDLSNGDNSYGELHISKLNEWDGSIYGHLNEKLYRLQTIATSFKYGITYFEASSDGVQLHFGPLFDPRANVDEFKFKVKDELLLVMEDFLTKAKDMLLPKESDQIKRICWKRFYSKEMEAKHELLIKRFQEHRKGKVFLEPELKESVLFGQHWFQCQIEPICYSVVGKEGKWSYLEEMMPAFVAFAIKLIEHENVKPLHFDGIGFSCS